MWEYYQEKYVKEGKGLIQHSLADLFNWPPSWVFWEAFRYATITSQRPLILRYPPLFIAMNSFTQSNKLEQRGVNKLAKKCKFKMAKRGVKSGISWLSAMLYQHASTVLYKWAIKTSTDPWSCPCSTCNICSHWRL